MRVEIDPLQMDPQAINPRGRKPGLTGPLNNQIVVGPTVEIDGGGLRPYRTLFILNENGREDEVLLDLSLEGTQAQAAAAKEHTRLEEAGADPAVIQDSLQPLNDLLKGSHT